MASLGTMTILDGWRLEASIGPGSYEQYLVTFAGGAAADDYTVGGQTIAVPTEIKGAQFVCMQVLAVSALTRTWVWDGSQSEPELIALEAFGDEEAATTDVDGDTVTAIITVKR
jgi:hypothetical protein